MPDSSYDFAPEDPASDSAATRPEEATSPDAPLPPVKKLALSSRESSQHFCPQCGFKIIGKTRRARCPECSAPLDASVADLLQFSNPAWIRAIAWGPLLMAAGILGHLVAIVMVFKGLPALSVSALHLIAGMLIAGGIWIATTPEPQGPPRRMPIMGNLARWSPPVVCVLWLLAVILILSKHSPTNNSLTIITLVYLAFAVACAGFFLSALCGRIPNGGLATQFQNLAWIMPVVLVFVMVFQLFDMQTFFGWFFFCGFPLAGGLAGLTLWTAVSLVRLTLDLRMTAAAAELLAVKRMQRNAIRA